MAPDHDTFTIIFDKLQRATAEAGFSPTIAGSEAAATEIDEIAELRRLVLEITEPDPISYTTA
jgi:hypothetical protein